MDQKNTNPATNKGQNPVQGQPQPPRPPQQQAPKTATPPPAQAAGQGQQMPPAGAQGSFPPGSYPPGYPPMGYPQGYPPMYGDPYGQQGAYPPQQGMPGGYYPPNYYPPQGQMPPQGYPAPGAYPPGYPQAPQGGFPPQGQGFPPQGMAPQGAPMPGQMPPAAPEDTTPANFQLGTKLPAKLNVKAPKSELGYDDVYFIRLLAGSISLSKDEKKKIIESIPKLKQAQIDELIRIFEEEKQKFAALSKKHVPQLEKLAQQHFDEWMDLEHEWDLSQKKTEDTSKADAIRKQLGI